MSLEAAATPLAARVADPVTLEVIRNRLQAITREMSTTIVRTAVSTVISEARDFSCTVFDTTGNLVSQKIAWVPGTVPALNRAYFKVPGLPPAQSYRVSVWAFDFVQSSGSPLR